MTDSTGKGPGGGGGEKFGEGKAGLPQKRPKKKKGGTAQMKKS